MKHFSNKRYIVLCAGCRLLHDTTRKNVFSCSTKCRARLHRNPSIMAELREDARRHGITPFGILQGAAADWLCPEGVDDVLRGTLKPDDIRPIVQQKYDELVATVTRDLIAAEGR